MDYIIGTARSPIDWNVRGTARIAQNAQNLLCTWMYEVAYERTKGVDPRIVDLPFEQAKIKMKSEIYRVIGTYEPLAEIKDIFVDGTNIGDMRVEVALDISLSEEDAWQN